MRSWALKTDRVALYHLYDFVSNNMNCGGREKLYLWLGKIVTASKELENKIEPKPIQLLPITFDPLIPDVTEANVSEVFKSVDYSAIYVSHVRPLSAKHVGSNITYIHALAVFDVNRLPVLFVNYEYNSLTDTFALCTMEGNSERCNYGRDDNLLQRAAFLKRSFLLLEKSYEIRFQPPAEQPVITEHAPPSKISSSEGGFQPVSIKKTTSSSSDKNMSDIKQDPTINTDEIAIPEEILSLKGVERLDVPKRISLKNFFKNSNKISQIRAMNHIFDVSDEEASEIASQIKHAFEQYDFIPWPTKK